MPKGLDHRTASDAADADDGSQLDVLILFTRAALRAEGGLRQMRASIDFAVAYANEAFAASGVDLRMLAWGDSATCSGTTPVTVGDIGDVPESSALLSMGGTPRVGRIADDADTDVFRWTTGYTTGGYRVLASTDSRLACD